MDMSEGAYKVLQGVKGTYDILVFLCIMRHLRDSYGAGCGLFVCSLACRERLVREP